MLRMAVESYDGGDVDEGGCVYKTRAIYSSTIRPDGYYAGVIIV